MNRQATLVVAMLLLAPNLKAHEGHTHEAATETAPHGGLLRDAAPFKAEAVVIGDTVRVYIYDQQLKPVALDKKSLSAVAQFPKQKKKPVTFKLKDNVYEAVLIGISKVHRFDLHVTLDVNGIKALADFGIDNVQ